MPPCGLPMVPLVPMVPLAAEIVQGFLVTIGKNGTNSTIGRFTDFTIGRTPNVAIVNFHGSLILPYCIKAKRCMSIMLRVTGRVWPYV